MSVGLYFIASTEIAQNEPASKVSEPIRNEPSHYQLSLKVFIPPNKISMNGNRKEKLVDFEF